MSRFKKFVAGFLLVVIVLAGFIFTSFNTTEVPLWLGREFAPRPVGQWVIAAFALGGILGLILGFGLFSRLKYKLQIRQLSARLKEAEKERAAARRGQ